MSRRNERRQQIETAFADLRRSIALALGLVARERDSTTVRHAERMFELWLREVGVGDALRDPGFRAPLANPRLAGIVETAVAERDEHFLTWQANAPAEFAELLRAAAPGSAGLPWADWLGRPGEHDGRTPIPDLWRIGTAVLDPAPEHEPFGVAVPLLDTAHLHVTSKPSNRTEAEALVEGLLLRVISHFQPGLVHLHVWDVGQLTGPMLGLFPLTRAGLLAVHDPGRLGDLLDELAEHIRRIHTRVLIDGYPALHTLAAETGSRGEPWRVVVLFGNREALPAAEEQKLQLIARNGLSCGIQLVLVDIPVTVNSAVETVRLLDGSSGTCTMTGEHATVTLDPPPPRDLVAQACAAVADTLVTRRATGHPFRDLLPAELWQCQSASGLQTPIGYHDVEPVYLSMDDASPHALIGGPSGSGKTNFLYAMLAALASRYSPDELEMYLLDFKEGVSFAQFAPGRKDPSWLPHARLVGVNVNEDREFGLALLRYLVREMRRRADAAKQHEVTKLEDLRAEDPGGRWPRIVAVIDEFQYLFACRDAVTSQAAALLEDVARRGRSQGIHLVLASQDVSGIEAFWGKPAIFEQFTLRIALPKARRVLGDTNSAAMEIPRWHAVVNHEAGVPQGNQLARIPNATVSGTVDELQQRLWRQRPNGLTEPRLFDGGHLPRLDELADFERLRPVPGNARTVLVGQIIDVAGQAAEIPLRAAPGRNIAVFGSTTTDTCNVLSAAALSLARQHDPGSARFSVCCPVDEFRPQAAALTRQLRQGGHQVEEFGAERLRARLGELADELDTQGGGADPGGRRYLLLYGADAALPLLEQKDAPGTPTGLDLLRRILKLGPERGTHTISWWRSVQRLKTVLLGPALDDIGAWVAFDVQGSELSSLAAGQVITWSPRAHRGLFFDRSAHARPEVLIPPRTESILEQ